MLGKQSKITLMILGLCMLSILILGIGVFLWQQQASKTNELKNETAQLMVKKQEIEEKLGPNDKNIEIEANTLKNKKESLKVLQKNLMDYQYIPKFLNYIQTVAHDTGNELVSIAPGEAKPIDFNNPLFKPAPKEGSEGAPEQAPSAPSIPKDPKKQYKSMPITISMKGTYVSSVKFINSLRKFPQLIYIKNLTLSPNELNGKIVVSTVVTTNALIVPEQYINSTKMRQEKNKKANSDNTPVVNKKTTLPKDKNNTTSPAVNPADSSDKPAVVKEKVKAKPDGKNADQGGSIQ